MSKLNYKLKIGERLLSLRVQNNLTQSALAKELNIPQTTYSDYETEKYNPSMRALIKLADLYDTSIDYIVGLIDSDAAHKRNR